MLMEIPVKPWMHKYLAREYGNPYIMDCTDPISSLLHANLIRKSDIVPEKDFQDGNTDRFKIRIPTYFAEMYSLVDMSYKNKVAIRDLLEDMFYDRLTEYVVGKQELKKQFEDIPEVKAAISVNKCIQQFLNRYNITDEHYEIKSVERRFRMHKRKKGLTVSGDKKYL